MGENDISVPGQAWGGEDDIYYARAGNLLSFHLYRLRTVKV